VYSALAGKGVTQSLPGAVEDQLKDRLTFANPAPDTKAKILGVLRENGRALYA